MSEETSPGSVGGAKQVQVLIPKSRSAGHSPSVRRRRRVRRLRDRQRHRRGLRGLYTVSSHENPPLCGCHGNRGRLQAGDSTGEKEEATEPASLKKGADSEEKPPGWRTGSPATAASTTPPPSSSTAMVSAWGDYTSQHALIANQPP